MSRPNFLVDKGTLASSSVMGIQTDEHLVGQQYSLLGTILYVGIIVGEVRCFRSKILVLIQIASFRSIS